MCGPQQSIFAPLKSKGGNTTLTQPENILSHWCDHYIELLDFHPIVDEFVQNLIEQRVQIVSLDEVPSWDKINIAEILKCGRDKMIDLLE